MIPTLITKGWRAETKIDKQTLKPKEKRKKRVLFSYSPVGKTTSMKKHEKEKKPRMIELDE